MKIRFCIYTIGICLLSGCGRTNGEEDSFQEVQIDNSDHFLILPSGIEENEVNRYEEGFTQHFKFSDSSYVIVLKGGNAELAIPDPEKADKFSRQENVEGIQMLYGNVNAERRPEFDQAFDSMKKNGLKKK